MTESKSAWERIKIIVADVLDAEPAQRRELLEQACGGDQQLLAEVSSLISAHDNSTGVIDRRTDSFLGINGQDQVSLAGQRIGRYKLERLLAEGAMAAVYVAQQTSPNRKVAIKLLRASLPMLDAAQRFKREAAALGRLQHPNIAQIYESGVHRVDNNQATPYLAMELVDGKPLNIHARDNRLSRPQRVILLIKVARAVHAAHQQAVIHRDLKPANVLVDSAGEPKVLDFGIARIIGVDEDNATWHTTAGVLLGTPGYMSPEQAGGKPELVDVRSDVWSLGVLLFELLTDQLPVQVKNTSIVEVLKRIETTEAPPISRIDPSLRGDLETIVATALSREKAQRYSSAEALADDLQRVLDYEPITARPPTRWYRLRKFARRHRVGLSVSVILLVAMIAATILASIGFVRASRERDIANRERDRSNSINNFLQGLLSAPDPTVGSKDMTVLQAITAAEGRIAKDFANDPATESQARSTLGMTYFQLGDYAAAERQARRAWELAVKEFGEHAERTLDETARLATALRWLERPEEAEKLAREACAAGAKEHGNENASVLALMDAWAGSLADQDKLDDAQRLYEKVVEIDRKVLGVRDELTLTAMNNLALIYLSRAQLERAEPLLRELIAVRSQVLGEKSPVLFVNRHNLLTVLVQQNRSAEVMEEYHTLLNECTAVLGAEHWTTLNVRASYADTLSRAGRHEEAIALQRDAVASRVRQFGADAETTMLDTIRLCWRLMAAEQFTEAESISRDGLSRATQKDGAESFIANGFRETLAISLEGQGRYSEAAPLFRETIEFFTRLYGEDHLRVVVAQAFLGQCLLGTGHVDDALAILRAAEKSMVARKYGTAEVRVRKNLGRALIELSQFEEAERQLLRAYEVEQAAPDPRGAVRIAVLLADLYERQARLEDAALWHKRSSTPATNPTTRPG